MITLPPDKDGGTNGTAKVLTGAKTVFTNQGKMSTPTTTLTKMDNGSLKNKLKYGGWKARLDDQSLHETVVSSHIKKHWKKYATAASLVAAWKISKAGVKIDRLVNDPEDRVILPRKPRESKIDKMKAEFKAREELRQKIKNETIRRQQNQK